jgi:YfiR/HmsC-like
MDTHLQGMTSCSSKTGAFDCPSLWRVFGAPVSRRRRGAGILAGSLAFCLVAAFSHAQNHLPEYDVKAAYLFNFGKFVRFTSSGAVIKRQSFDICIVGEDPLGHTLDELTANEQLDGEPVRIVRLKAAAEARGCAIAYISASEGSRVGTDLDALHGQAVLTVSDAAKFLQHGGMIQFINVANHVRFAVNLDAVRSAQLSLSSELLRVAVSVNGEAPAGVRP